MSGAYREFGHVESAIGGESVQVDTSTGNRDGDYVVLTVSGRDGDRPDIMIELTVPLASKLSCLLRDATIDVAAIVRERNHAAYRERNRAAYREKLR